MKCLNNNEINTTMLSEPIRTPPPPVLDDPASRERRRAAKICRTLAEEESFCDESAALELAAKLIEANESP